MVVAKAILTLLGIVTLIAAALLARECTPAPAILPICGDPDFHTMVPILALTLIFAFLDFARR
ncbi:hypothetical protein [Thermus scotoductus]|uniref:Uncharacterized protein n=1 Tax=Thermus scotoductus TaxID=37636 RepID=A0A430S4F6_THESC|nr:hypothetical protein [Thermus scotoductus]RTH03225.1 hypothetical protein CSW47_09120 [Thermus scotoductus]RTH28780.1 hypothetical protein CSW40_00255 [Thermus scotoductus]RTI16338.1 hypothetical protein CSW27_03930 [Thermus scotoductus]RTI38642.1 hypothetical protein CSW18_07775 [Thermus scotoductus]RTI54801.1 hypothetical protein CSW14_07130 [Thermus scotoductus]